MVKKGCIKCKNCGFCKRKGPVGNCKCKSISTKCFC